MNNSAALERIHQVFSNQIPEVKDGLVQIKSIAWELGRRLLVAVHATNPNVDAVSVCARPPRPKWIQKELGQERLQIILWNEKPAEFIKNAVSHSSQAVFGMFPTPVVTLDANARLALVEVDKQTLDDLLRENAVQLRLASELVGWHLQVKSASAQDGGATTP